MPMPSRVSPRITLKDTIDGLNHVCGTEIKGTKPIIEVDPGNLLLQTLQNAPRSVLDRST